MGAYRRGLFFFLFSVVCSVAYAQDLRVQDVLALDRLRLSGGEEVRLAGIAPPSDADLVEKGMQFLEGLIKGKALEVEPVGEAPSDAVLVWFEIFPDSAALDLEPTDLPRFYVTRKREVPEGTATYVFLNATLVNAGYARVVPIASRMDLTSEMQGYYDRFHQHYPDMCTPDEEQELP